MFGATTIYRRGAAEEAEAREERMAVLARVPELARCTRQELERIDATATEVRCKPGTVVHHAHHRVRQVVVVLEGAVLERAHGTTWTRGVGHLVGEEALRRPGALAASSVAAATPLRALVIGLRDLPDIASLPGVQHRYAVHAPVRVPARAQRRAFDPVWSGAAVSVA
jgi:hypothetical protein